MTLQGGYEATDRFLPSWVTVGLSKLVVLKSRVTMPVGQRKPMKMRSTGKWWRSSVSLGKPFS
jgi:hypothetical protein